jgi:enterochelin esterase family protein
MYEVFDPAGKRQKALELSLGEMKVGFVARLDGTYRVRFSSIGQQPTSFSWKTSTESPRQRMANRRFDPVVTYESPRIKQLAKEIAGDPREAVSRFWAEVQSRGAPLVEPLPAPAGGRGGAAATPAAEHVLVTFLWREMYETFNVEVVRAPYGPAAYRLMTHLSGTDVWYKTMKVHKSSRFMYWLAPNYRGYDADGDIPQELDPLNPRRFPDDRDQWIGRREQSNDPATASGSVLSLSDAPDESWVRSTPRRPVTVATQEFRSPSLKATMSLHIYTPPQYTPSAQAYPFIVLFDGPAYATGITATPITLENLITAGRIRPAIACFVSSVTHVVRNRAANLSSPAFADAVATELVPWLRSVYPISSNPQDLIIGGSSAGAVAGGRTALRHPDVFGNVLAQSGGAALIDEVIAEPKAPVRFYMDLGLYELTTTVAGPFDEMVLTESMTVRNRHFRDVLRAKGYEVIFRETGGDHSPMHWRATLAEALMALLGTPPR